ncbi:MAG: AAA domain-containing protein, partial [Rhodoferax sp.]
MNENKPVLVRRKEGDWEDKSEDVLEFRHLQQTHRIEICFKSAPGQWFSYSQERVRLLGSPITTHSPAAVQLRVAGRVLRGVDAITKYSDFYIVTSQGRRKPYAVSEVSVERNVAFDPACRTALNYFRNVSELAGAQNDEDESLLTKQFSYLDKVSDASVLAKYLFPEAGVDHLEASEKPLIYPFGTNVSQKIAVEKTFQSQVVLVQGPPGTGKTQTILNIIANAIYLGQTVAVVSNNNAAIQNVVDKLDGKELGFLLAKLGRRDNKDAFIAQQSVYPDWVKQSQEKSLDVSQLELHLKLLTTSLDQLIQANNDRAMLVAKLKKTQNEFEFHRQLEGAKPSKNAIAMLDRWSARDWLMLQIECEETNPKARIGLLRLLKQIFLYGPWGTNKRRKLFIEGPMVLRSLYYEKYLSELQSELSRVERVLTENNFE